MQVFSGKSEKLLMQPTAVKVRMYKQSRLLIALTSSTSGHQHTSIKLQHEQAAVHR
jgi:hypothetical protein